MSKNYAIILAAGSGSRTRQSLHKAFVKINDLYMLEYSIIAFSDIREINDIILVVPKEYLEITKQLIHEKSYSKITSVLAGEKSRFESSRKGLSEIKESDAYVLIHDAARPFVSGRIINDCISKLKHVDAVNVLAPISDTLVRIDSGNITETLDRNQFRQTQTPQGFNVSAIKEAHKLALKENIQNITDDFSLVMTFQTGSISWVNGSIRNFKITYTEDVEFVQSFFE